MDRPHTNMTTAYPIRAGSQPTITTGSTMYTAT